MRKNLLIIIFLVIIVFGGILLLSPYSPLNKVSIHGQTFNIPSGYKVENTSKNFVIISNGTNELVVEYHKKNVTLDGNVDEYLERFENTSFANISVSNLTTNNGNDYIKTVNIETKSDNKTLKTIRSWFFVGNSSYSINCKEPDEGTEEVMKEIIDSMI